MSVTIPDPRFEAPELLDSGRKPIGNVVIDWSHPFLSKYELIHFFVASASSTFSDLVHGKCEVSAANPEAGQAYFQGSIGGTIKATVDESVSNTDCTVLSRQQSITGGGAFPAIWGKGDTGGDEMMLRFSSSTIINWYQGGSVASATISAGTYNTVTCAYDHSASTSATRNSMHVNGVLQTSSITSTRNISTTKKFEIGNADSGIATNRHLKGFIDYVIVFRSAMSDDDQSELHRNPYKFLIPA